MSARRTHLCPGSGSVVSQFKMAPGRSECLTCKRFVPLTNAAPGTRLQLHERELDRHEPFSDDGVTYCGWADDVGVIDGCGEMWPCSAVRAAVHA